jgi:hypothetical protein
MIYINEGQSVLDIAIQENGSVLAAFELALVNGLSITDDLDYLPLKSIQKKEYESLDVTLFLKKVNNRKATVIIIENQSLFDIAIQVDGNALAAFDWALSNGLSITDSMEIGKKLKMPKSELYRYDDLSSYFKGRNVATGHSIENSDLPIDQEGIGAMIIETSFIVN